MSRHRRQLHRRHARAKQTITLLSATDIVRFEKALSLAVVPEWPYADDYVFIQGDCGPVDEAGLVHWIPNVPPRAPRGG